MPEAGVEAEEVAERFVRHQRRLHASLPHCKDNLACFALGLQAGMGKAMCVCRFLNDKIHARILDQPFGIAFTDNRGFGAEQLGVKCGWAMVALNALAFSTETLEALRPGVGRDLDSLGEGCQKGDNS